jgi:hypothetical protein
MTKLMKMVAILAVCLAGPSARATPAATADEAAKHTLSQLSGLPAKGLKHAGIAGADEAKKSGLDAPLPVYMVGLDTLKAYDGQKPDKELLLDLQQVLYPVVVNGEVTSSLGVQKTEQGWETSEIRSPELAKLVVQIRGAAMTAEKRRASSFFLVRIPALQMVFVAQGDNELSLRSVVDVPELGLAANTPISGRALFAKLAPIAREYKEVAPPQ